MPILNSLDSNIMTVIFQDQVSRSLVCKSLKHNRGPHPRPPANHPNPPSIYWAETKKILKELLPGRNNKILGPLSYILSHLDTSKPYKKRGNIKVEVDVLLRQAAVDNGEIRQHF